MCMKATNKAKITAMLATLSQIKETEEERLDALGEKEGDSAQEKYDALQEQLDQIDAIIESIEELVGA